MSQILNDNEIKEFNKNGAILLKDKFDKKWIKKLKAGINKAKANSSPRFTNHTKDQRLPSYLVTLSYYNPFFHMIDGFRYSFINSMDGSIKFGLSYLIIISVLMWIIAYTLYKKGYKIKS